MSERPITDPTQHAGGTSSAPVGSQPVSSSRRRDTDEQAVAMDRMYRLTRHVYDVTRRYYLLGRDRLLAKVATAPGTATLEVGCGTARNLVKLARLRKTGGSPESDWRQNLDFVMKNYPGTIAAETARIEFGTGAETKTN